MKQVAFLLDPHCYLPDIIGVYAAFSVHPGIEFAFYWQDLKESQGFPARFPTRPTHTFDQLPLDIACICVGAGSPTATKDAKVQQFLRQASERAEVVVGVCAGVEILAASGCLDGRKITGSYPVLEALKGYDVEVTEPESLIQSDGKFITAGPVHCSIEAGLLAVERVLGREAAELSQLLLEYHPHPPFNTGSYRTAPPKLVKKAHAVIAQLAI